MDVETKTLNFSKLFDCSNNGLFRLVKAEQIVTMSSASGKRSIDIP